MTPDEQASLLAFYEAQTRALITEKVRAFYAGSVMGLDAGGQISKMVEAEIERRWKMWEKASA